MANLTYNEDGNIGSVKSIHSKNIKKYTNLFWYITIVLFVLSFLY